MGDVPESEQRWDYLAQTKGYKCGRCEVPIPYSEREIYFEKKLCSWRLNQLEKLNQE